MPNDVRFHLFIVDVMAIEHADFDGIERLSLVLGGEVTSTFDNPDKVKLGECDLIDEIMIGEDTVCDHASSSTYLVFLVAPCCHPNNSKLNKTPTSATNPLNVLSLLPS